MVRPALKYFVIVVIVLAYSLVTLGGTGGIVICVERSGRLALEPADMTCCHQHVVKHSPGHKNSSVCQPVCPKCTDYPVPNAKNNITAKAAVPALAKAWLNHVWIPFNSCVPLAVESRLVEARTTSPPVSFDVLSRTSVILI